MATADYIISNQSGASFRTDLNNTLAAIVSNNSNSSSPATTYAYQWWADTSNGILKIRNSANNAWIELLQLDGTLTLEDGSASTPALAFRDDLNTGIFSSAADTFNVATGGVERMELGTTTIFNEDGADVDFRIEGDTNANLFYVDAGNDRIGMGTNSPSNFLHCSTSDTTVARFESTAAGATGVELILHHSTSSPADNDNVSGIYFQGNHDGSSTHTYAYILVQATDVSDGSEDANYFIYTSTAGTANQKLRLNDEGIALSNLSSGGGLAIDVTNVTGQYAQIGGNANRTGDFDVLLGLVASWNGDSVAQISFQAGNDTSNKDNGKIAFFTQANNSDSLQYRMLINEDGQVLIGGTTNGYAPNTNERFIVYGNTNVTSRIALVATHNDDNPATLDIAKSRTAGNAILGDNDDVGCINFSGNDGNGYHVMARIQTTCSGSGNGNDQLPADIRFFTLPSSSTTLQERVRINSAGKFLVGTTSGANFNNSVAEFLNTADAAVGVRSTTGASQQDFITFKYGGGPTACGGIRRDGTNNGPELFSNSDRRIKTNILDMDNVLDKINQLALKKFDFQDGSGSGVGLIAQDLVSIFPSKVKKDASDDGTGDTVPDGVDPWTVGHNFTYELLKAIQELTARVAALEAA